MKSEFLTPQFIYFHFIPFTPLFRKLGLDLVIRDEEGSIQNPNLLSTVALYNKHETAMQRIGQQDKVSCKLRLHCMNENSMPDDNCL